MNAVQRTMIGVMLMGIAIGLVAGIVVDALLA